MKDWLTTTLDCGDNSCLFRDRTKPGGIRTNGGCHCLVGLSAEKQRFVFKMLWEIKRLRERVKDGEEY
jgi:hypothetical protein